MKTGPTGSEKPMAALAFSRRNRISPLYPEHVNAHTRSANACVRLLGASWPVRRKIQVLVAIKFKVLYFSSGMCRPDLRMQMPAQKERVPWDPVKGGHKESAHGLVILENESLKVATR